MGEKRDSMREPKQTTKKGLEIPVPKRDDFLRDLAKVAQKPEPAKRDGKQP